MLVQFIEAASSESIAINPTAVVAVFTVPEGDQKGKTVIGVSNGSIVVNEKYVDVVGALQGELK